MLRHKFFSKSPQRPDALRIEDESSLRIATIVQVHGRKNFIQVHVRNLRHVHIAEIKNIDILLSMIGNSAISQHNKHEKIDRVIIVINTQTIVEFVSLDEDERLHIAIMAVGVHAS